jgi:hypothetical protein
VAGKLSFQHLRNLCFWVGLLLLFDL